ncbi:MAG: hypothetical protein JST81_13515 [Bacteroidetes bacterium]|nr:hypothetical protein [Bacteroidota bacterium]
MTTAHAQEDTLVMHPEWLTVKDGLSQGLISSIIQDKEGLMWFGTMDGLNKYDGYNFTVYRKQQDNPFSLPDNFITALQEDDKGNFWIGTNTGGLCLFDKKHEKFYRVRLPKKNESLSNNTVSYIKYRNGKLMVIDSKMAIYDVSKIAPRNYAAADLSKSAIYFESDQSLPAESDPSLSGVGRSYYDKIYSSVWMPDNSLWFCFPDSILVFNQIGNGPFKKIKSFSSTITGFVDKDDYQPAELPTKSEMLFVNKHELIIVNIESWQIIKKIAFTDNYDKVKHIERLPDGNYYFTSPVQSYFFNSKAYTLLPIKRVCGSTTCIDRNDILWVGTSGNGLIRYDPAKTLFRNIKQDSELKFSYNNKGALLYRTPQGPAFFNIYTNKTTQLLPPGTWKVGRLIREFLNTGNGKNWIICINENEKKHFLILYDDQTGKIVEKEITGFMTAMPFRLFADRSNRLWIGAFNSYGNPVLWRINNDNLETEAVYPVPAKSQNHFGQFISAAWQDDSGIFWFATLQGLYSFNEKKKKWQHWQHNATDKNSLSGDQLLSILPDPKEPGKYLWLGTEGSGLNRFEIATGKCKHYTDKEGLPNNVIYGLLSDSAGNIWLSSNKGISCLNPQNNVVRNFSILDGLPGDEFNRHEYFKHPNGELLFGGVEGGVIFNPSAVLKKERAPDIIFTGLSIYNKPVDYLSDSSVINGPITYANSITLPSDKNMFSISFAALEFRDAGTKHYKYYLKGYDKQWIDAGNKNEATYTNLNPGTYTFRVTAAGRDYNWNEKGATIKVIILPAWYQTWKFRIALAMSIAGLIFAFYRYRLKQVLRLQSIRNNIASDLHDEIGSTLSSISLSSAVIQKKLNTIPAEVEVLLQQIGTNTDDMMEAMSDIVWAVNTKNDSFESVINRMRAFAIELLEPKNINLHMRVSGLSANINLDMRQRKNIYLIFKEAVHNCVKYAHCRNLWIDIEKKSDRITMVIKDDGCGFDFSEPNLESLGGNGMHNMHTRAREMKGTLEIGSGNGKGTVLKLSFPV